MIAALGMYDFPHMQGANDQLWQLIRKHLGDGPEQLTRDQDLSALWRSPDLLFAQTCGLPFRSHLHAQTRLIATPDYGLKGCPPGYYNSVILVHQNADEERVQELEGQLLAYNDPLSQSGWAAVQAHMADAQTPFLCGPCTGSHLASARAILQGDADFAALDALTWELLEKHDPRTHGQLRVIGRTAPTPALPFITSLTQDVTALRTALGQAVQDLSPQSRKTLHLKGVIQVPVEHYLNIPLPPAP